MTDIERARELHKEIGVIMYRVRDRAEANGMLVLYDPKDPILSDAPEQYELFGVPQDLMLLNANRPEIFPDEELAAVVSKYKEISDMFDISHSEMDELMFEVIRPARRMKEEFSDVDKIEV